jgi:hypothetical protein
MLKKVAFLAVLLLVVAVEIVGAASPATRKPRGLALPYNGTACPDGYERGIRALRPSSPENPLRLDQPEGNWMYVCTPTRPWTERAISSYSPVLSVGRRTRLATGPATPWATQCGAPAGSPPPGRPEPVRCAS